MFGWGKKIYYKYASASAYGEQKGNKILKKKGSDLDVVFQSLPFFIGKYSIQMAAHYAAGVTA